VLACWSYNETEGIGRCVVELSKLLAKHHEVHILTAWSDNSSQPGITIHRIQLRLRPFYIAEWEFFFRAGAFLRKNSFDMVHLHFPAFLPVQAFTCHGVARAAIQTLRRLPPAQRSDVPLRWLLPFYLQLPLHSYHLRNPRTLVAAVSDRTRRELSAYYNRPPASILTIPNGVDIDRFRPERVKEWRAATRAQLGIQDDQFLLLFAGHMLRRKGARYAVETVAKLPERAILLIVGGDTLENLPDPSGSAKRLLRSGRLIFSGYQREMWRCYGAADALLFPSLYESFGMVVLEAMASGLPVVTVRTVPIGEEAIQDGESGFIVDAPWEVEGLVDRVRALMDNPGIGQDIAAIARQVAERYSWDHYVKRTQAMYEAALSGGKER
jgi:UDP-glucose:(heptosyl)LPS alpha-1,3-glucosyltransferase